MNIKKIIEHVYGLHGYSKLLIDDVEHELSWNLDKEGNFKYSTDNEKVIKAFEDTF